MTQVVPPPEPRVSRDGRFYLDADRWVPLPTRPASRRDVRIGVAEGIGTAVNLFVFGAVVLPLLVWGVSVLVLDVAPERWASVALIATWVVIVGCVIAMLRSRRRR